MLKKKAELLSPAGDLQRLYSAIEFGADAVYLAGVEFGMRSAPSNFTAEELKTGVEFAHKNNIKVYLTCNTVPTNDEIERLPEFIKQSAQCGVDAFIVCDIGVLQLVKEYAPEKDVHISTQAGICNYAAANEFYKLGADRVVLARELSFDDIAKIRDKTPPELEIEAFVHGSMCVSFSGRCLLSSYLTGRDANRGDCAQPCRWKYSLVEETRPGEYMPIYEENGGAHILNSKDMCMIDHIPRLHEVGIDSFKIEGRAKSSYYVSVTTNAYRQAMDLYYKDPENYVLPDWIRDELNKVSHRQYSAGFFLGKEPGQVYDNGGYVRDYKVVAVVDDCRDGYLYLTQKNKFFVGDTLDVLEPFKKSFTFKVEALYNENDESIESAPHAMMKLKVPFEGQISKNSLLRIMQ